MQLLCRRAVPTTTPHSESAHNVKQLGTVRTCNATLQANNMSAMLLVQAGCQENCLFGSQPKCCHPGTLPPTALHCALIVPNHTALSNERVRWTAARVYDARTRCQEVQPFAQTPGYRLRRCGSPGTTSNAHCMTCYDVRWLPLRQVLPGGQSPGAPIRIPGCNWATRKMPSARAYHRTLHYKLLRTC